MNDRPRRIPLLVWSVTGVYWIGMFIITHLPPSRLPQTRMDDKIQHFIAYAVLAALLMLSLRFTNLSSRSTAWWTIGVCLVYAAIDELLQIPVGRTCSFADWLADATGAITTVCLITSVEAIFAARRV
jgi:VanZ family protein